MKKYAAQAASIMVLVGMISYFGNLIYSTYSMVVGIHSQYATKDELRDTYFQTKVDDWTQEKDDLEDRIAFYETKSDLEDGLSENDRDRLSSTRADLKATVEMIETFKNSIKEIGQ